MWKKKQFLTSYRGKTDIQEASDPMCHTFLENQNQIETRLKTQRYYTENNVSPLFIELPTVLWKFYSFVQ